MAPARIVICEDDPVIQKLLQVSLRDTGYVLLMAQDGVDGLALIEREQPDAILTDVAMPRMDGLQLADAVRSAPELADIPIVFLTASVQRIHFDEAGRHGATAYVTKPFRAADLRAALEWVLARTHRRRPAAE